MAAPGVRGGPARCARGGLAVLTWGLLGLLHLGGVPPGEALLPSGVTPEPSGVTPEPSGEPQEGQVRLAGGPHRCAGRVEVFHAGRWGSVCDDTWDLAAARVTCRQVRCGPALRAPPGPGEFGPGEGPVWLDDVTCAGWEAELRDCPARTWGENNCHHGEDAGVVCADADPLLQVNPQVNAQVHPQVNAQVNEQVNAQVNPQVNTQVNPQVHRQVNAQVPQVNAQVEPQVEPQVERQVDAQDRVKVRLVNGSSRCVGRVEVLHRNRWGSVCDDTWDMADAQVICRSLGCGYALAAPGHAHFGQGAGPIWLDGTHCTGEELTLARCALHTWGQHDCGHGEDAGAVCSGADPPQVRLRGGAGPCSGQVQVLLNSTWLQVCGLTWGPPEAQVLCRQLGCGPALSAPVGPHLAEQEPHLAQGQLYLAELTCRGSEQLLIECPKLSSGTCGTGAVAYVACEEPPAPPDPCPVLGALLGVGAGLCGALLGLYLCARCARCARCAGCARCARGAHPQCGQARPGEPLLPPEPPEQPGTAGETSTDQFKPV